MTFWLLLLRCCADHQRPNTKRVYFTIASLNRFEEQLDAALVSARRCLPQLRFPLLLPYGVYACPSVSA